MKRRLISMSLAVFMALSCFGGMAYAGENDSQPINRATMVEALYQMAGSPEVSGENPFNDVPGGAEYVAAVTWAKQSGVTTGVGGGKFAPNAYVTREELAMFLLNYAKAAGSGPVGAWAIRLDCTDAAEISEWAIEGVMFSKINGLIDEKPGHLFDPNGIVTQSEAALSLERLAAHIGAPSVFAESAYIWFLEVSKIPRGSRNEKAVSDYLTAFGKERGFVTVQDGALNVLIKKPGSAGRENEPPLILQAHMDMVPEQNQGVGHDFLKDPILPVIEGDWVTAGKKMTLGADNAVGMAMILAVLDAKDLSHPPIEAIITTGEEKGMLGAAAFDVSLLQGKRFPNLDSEEEGSFTVSCAASADVDTTIPVELAAMPDGLTAYTLTIKGLTGGHSGLDINKGLANANLLTARLLRELSDLPVSVSSIDGGSARNAIPRECGAVISVSAENINAVKAAIAEAEAAYRSEYPHDTGLSIVLAETKAPASVLTGASLSKVLDGILNTPNGVLKMSPDIPGLVQTSNNLGVIKTSGSSVILSSYPRSSISTEQADTMDWLKELASSLGSQIEIANEVPPWPYKADSPLRDRMAEIFTEMYGEEPLVEALHAGLECALFAESMPDADLIAIGPTILGAHSPDERLSLSSFNRVCDYLVLVLQSQL